jgi:hypothetical protein
VDSRQTPTRAKTTPLCSKHALCLTYCGSLIGSRLGWGVVAQDFFKFKSNLCFVALRLRLVIGAKSGNRMNVVKEGLQPCIIRLKQPCRVQISSNIRICTGSFDFKPRTRPTQLGCRIERVDWKLPGDSPGNSPGVRLIGGHSITLKIPLPKIIS